MQVIIGEIYEGKVTGLTNFGAFVKLSTGETGMVHISEVATSFVQNINEHLSEGQDVKVKVLSVNEAGKISLSIRQALPRPAENPRDRERKGDRPFDRNGGKPAQRAKRPVQTWQGNHYEEKPQSFEDMMAKFKQTSDERQSGMKKPVESRRGGSRRGNGNNGGNKW